jgi:hypothetical protein
MSDSPISTESIVHKSEHKHYLIKWKLVLTMQANGVTRNFHGWFGDISMQDGTAYLENNLPVKTQFTAVFALPPKAPHEQPKLIQANCKSTYCVLGNNGMFRAGITFISFSGNGREELAKELENHIAHG